MGMKGDGDARRKPGACAAAAGRRLALADGMDGASTWNMDFVGRLRQTAAVGEGLTSTLAALGLQRCSGAVPPARACFFGGQSLASTQQPAGGQGRECAGIAKTTPLRLSLTPGRPPNLGHQSLFLVWPTQTEFTRHRLRLEMDAACCSGHRRTKKLKKKRYGVFVPVPGPGR